MTVDKCRFSYEHVGGTGFDGDGIITIANGSAFNQDVGSPVIEVGKKMQQLSTGVSRGMEGW